MLKTFVEWLASKSISDFSTQTIEEKARLQKEYLQYVGETLKADAEAQKQAMTPEALQIALKDVFSGLVPVAEFDGFKTRLEEAEEALAQMKEAGKGGADQSFAGQIKQQILSQKDVWTAMKTDRTLSLAIAIKAPADMLVSTNTTGRVARIEIDTERVGVARRNPFMLNIVNSGQTNAATMYWVEREAHEGTPTFTAEGAAKPQLDWEYVERSRPVRKLPAFVKISKEMMDDVDNIAQDIALELSEQILLVADANLLTGNNIGQNLAGVALNATPFAPGATLLNTVVAANDADVLRAAVAQVYRNNFVPNYIVVHPDRLASMEMMKASDGHYIMPPFKSADGTAIAAVPVIANNGVAQGSFFVGDFNKYKARIKEGLSIAIGYDGNDWTNNMVTPLAEMRLVGYIASNNYGAIVTGTFTVGKALLDPAVADS